MISKSVFRYCKVSFYPPNIDIVFFTENIRISISMPSIKKYILIYWWFQYFSVSLWKHSKTFFFSLLKCKKKVFCFVYPLKRTTAHHTMLGCFCYCLICEWHGHACLLLLICSLQIITTYKNAISCSSHDSTSLSCQTWPLTNYFLFVFEILIII